MREIFIGLGIAAMKINSPHARFVADSAIRIRLLSNRVFFLSKLINRGTLVARIQEVSVLLRRCKTA